jgi:hypothetical protein
MKKSTIIYSVSAFIAITLYCTFRIGFNATITFYEHLMIATFGAFLWNFGMFRNTKNVHEKNGTEFSWEQYKKDHWEDWAWSFMMSLPVVWFMPDIIKIMNQIWELPPYQAYYLIAGPLSLAAGFGVNWVIKKFGDA